MSKTFPLVEYKKPLVTKERPIPIPKGKEVLVKILASGLCHSDVHIQEGSINIPLPIVLGHEGAGIVVGVGNEVKKTKIGDKVIIFPWLSFDLERKNHVMIGVGHPEGTFSNHLLVPEERYCLPTQNISFPQAALLACSGVTAYSALKKAKDPLTSRYGHRKSLVIIGAGGVGLQAIRLAKIVTGVAPIVCDIDDNKLALAAKIGPKGTVTVNSKNPTKAEEQVVSLTSGGPDVVMDFVGSTATAQFAIKLLTLTPHIEKNGKYIVVGLFEGNLNVPLVAIITRKITIESSFVGNLEEINELISIVSKEKGLPDVPIIEKSFDASQISEALDNLREGKMTTGRIIFTSKL